MSLGCNKQLDVVLVLDFSGSVHHVYDIILEFAKRLIENLNIDSGDVRVGVVSYSNRATLQFNLNEFRTKKENLNAISGELGQSRNLKEMFETFFMIACK